MSRLRKSAVDEENDGGIDISPLIDCIFILLIFFIVTTTFVEETGMEVDKSQSAAAEPLLESTSITLEISPSGTVTHEGRSVGVRGVRPLVERLLRGASGDEVPVIIRAAKSSPAGRLVEVVGEARLAGATIVNIDSKRG